MKKEYIKDARSMKLCLNLKKHSFRFKIINQILEKFYTFSQLLREVITAFEFFLSEAFLWIIPLQKMGRMDDEKVSGLY